MFSDHDDIFVKTNCNFFVLNKNVFVYLTKEFQKPQFPQSNYENHENNHPFSR